ncbi:IS30 family transposase, partial [Corynebacterium sp. 13CS0277]|uniref:IS30 family transposase n=1 Tax=Corynebacterium sp. 13CS0277 TaxID=2071994 RepID=UPI000D03DDE1
MTTATTTTEPTPSDAKPIRRRRPLTNDDRATIAVLNARGCTLTEIAAAIDRNVSVVCREIGRNRNKNGTYKPLTAAKRAAKRRARPQQRRIDANPALYARVCRDLSHGVNPREISDRLRKEAEDPTVGPPPGSVDAKGATISHEAIYQWFYALPAGELKRELLKLRRGRTSRKPRSPKSQRQARIPNMTLIDERPERLEDRAVPGSWEGDLIIGKNGHSAVMTLVERCSRYLILKALPLGKNSASVADVLIDTVQEIDPGVFRALTWDQGTEMAQHELVTKTVGLPVYFAHPHSPWERGTNENTNRLVREYLPKGTVLPTDQELLDMIANEINIRPRRCLDS